MFINSTALLVTNLRLKSKEAQEGFEMNSMKEERLKKGWSQVTLSMKTGGIAPSDLSAIENGRKIPHAGWRKRIARALRVDEAELFGEKHRGGGAA